METDPTGRGAHDPGAKVDGGKPRMGLVLGAFSKALEEVGEVGTFGADKYSDNGWQQVPDGINRYMDAALRHIFKSFREDIDPDSGRLHMAHGAWCLLAILEKTLENKNVDNPNVGSTGCDPIHDDRDLGICEWKNKAFDVLMRGDPDLTLYDRNVFGEKV